jgi:hypothetical protein
MQTGPYSPDCYVVCNDYNPSANAPQRIYVKTTRYQEARHASGC